MATGIELLLIKGTQGCDITSLVKQIKWGGRKGSSSRHIEVTLLDDENLENARAELDVRKGYHCIFNYNGKELFQGIIMKQGNTSKKQLTFKAYDNGIYLAKNKDTFCYTNKTGADIFKDICTRFGLPYSEVSTTTYKIPELAKPKTTAWDALCDALSQDFRATGVRHYIDSQKGSLRLLTRRENILQWVIEVGQNLISYNSTVSIENIKTRIKLISDEGTVLAETKNAELEKAIGIFQDIDEPDETLNNAQLQELVKSMLDESSMPEESLKLEALGLPDVISGLGVTIIIPALGISRTYYVDEDTHIFKDQYHRMSLTLNAAFDIDEDTSNSKVSTKSSSSMSSSSDKKTQTVEKEVYFLGGNQYISSVSSSPIGGTRKAGPALMTKYAAGAKHPYYLIGGAYNDLSGDSNVRGWVNADQIK